MSNTISLGNLDTKIVKENQDVLLRFAAQRAGMLGLNLAHYTVHYDSATGQVTAELNEKPDIEVEVH